jgi:hypothetical protein
LRPAFPASGAQTPANDAGTRTCTGASILAQLLARRKAEGGAERKWGRAEVGSGLASQRFARSDAGRAGLNGARRAKSGRARPDPRGHIAPETPTNTTIGRSRTVGNEPARRPTRSAHAMGYAVSSASARRRLRSCRGTSRRRAKRRTIAPCVPATARLTATATPPATAR